MAAAQQLTITAMYKRQQEMWDSAFTMPQLSDIALALIRHKVQDI